MNIRELTSEERNDIIKLQDSLDDSKKEWDYCSNKLKEYKDKLWKKYFRPDKNAAYTGYREYLDIRYDEDYKYITATVREFGY